MDELEVSGDSPADPFSRALEELEAEIVTPAKKADIVARFTADMDQCAPLDACASCGQRDPDPKKRFPIGQLGRLQLQLDPQQVNTYLHVPAAYRKALSVYSYESIHGSLVHLHLHPELVQAAAPGRRPDEAEVCLCVDCSVGIAPHSKTELNPSSLAAGVDFARPARLGLPALTPAERALLAKIRVYETTFKIAEQSNKFKGQAVAFQHPGMSNTFDNEYMHVHVQAHNSLHKHCQENRTQESTQHGSPCGSYFSRTKPTRSTE